MVKILSLCPACSDCPAVEITEHEVRIGEGDNLVRLSPAEWNVLVQAIQTGDLDTIDPEEQEDRQDGKDRRRVQSARVSVLPPG